MKFVIKLSMIALTLSLITACATTSDFERLQSQVNGLDTSVKQASADAANAQARAAAAEDAANRAAQLSQDASKKIQKKAKNSINKKLKTSMME
jgi:murein lipoprotein